MSHSVEARPLPVETCVFIGGAGPAGLALAIGLAQRSIPFVLCDRLEVGRNTSRAAVVHARTLERLASLGVAEALAAQGNPVSTFTVRDRDATLLRLDFSRLPTAYPYALIIPQDRTEAALRHRLVQLGGTVHWRHAVHGFARAGEGAEVAVERDGGTATVRARFVVAAEGFHSSIREAAGIAFRYGTYPASFVLGDVEGDWPLGAGEVQLFLSEAGLMVAAPFCPGRLRVVATCGEAAETPTLADLRAIAEARGPRGARFERLHWSSRFRVHHGLAERYREGPVFLVGDAAHVHSPAGGQGMNTGIQDAIRLAELLADAIDGEPDALGRYEAERRPIARGVVAMTDRMTRLASLGGPWQTSLRNAALRGVGLVPGIRGRIAYRIAELDL